MSIPHSAFFIYLLPLLIVLTVYVYTRRQKESRYRRIQKEQIDAGLTEPASLHPVIDPAICIGCTACADACPEQNVLGVINGKAALISPSNCIGHGACRVACPVDAITLVFGTEKRGVDIPFVKPTFETNVPGIFIAGELGGMGLIRNAIEQGRQAMASIGEVVGKAGKAADLHDVVIVGAGPAGFSASLAAMEKKLDYITLEQEGLGGTVVHYPRGKIVMTQPATLPIIGKIQFKHTTKEKLLDFWQDIEKHSGVKIYYNERVEKVVPGDGYLSVKTQNNVYKTKTVLLAIGRRGTPRKLGVPGEDLSKVVYHLADPEQFANQHVLVVGGGDSALEAVVSLAETPGTTVVLSYRGDAFSRVKPKNREKIDEAKKQGRIQVLLNSNVKKIKEDKVFIDQQGSVMEFKNDVVIVCAGGVLPTPFLKEIGVNVETKFGTA